MAGTMRITGGTLVRRRFKVPEAADQGLVRPTSDRVREAIFSALGVRLTSARVLDLFGGSGAYGFESLSRGVATVTCVELTRLTANCIKQNALDLGIGNAFKLVIDDAVRFVSSQHDKYDVIFVDPPYTLTLDELFWQNLRPWLADDGIVVFRCQTLADFSCPPNYEIVREKAYGGTAVFFLQTDPICVLP